jgi:cytochrome c-type biogenesis protein CcmE
MSHASQVLQPSLSPARGLPLKFWLGGGAILVAIAALTFVTMQGTQQYFYSVDEVLNPATGAAGKSLRVTGAVLGDTIQVNAETLEITFDIAQVPTDDAEVQAAGGLAAVLHAAAINPTANHLRVVYVGPKPDLLKNEAQAIVVGKLGADGVFYADELLLKCPTRYEQAPGATPATP